MTFRRFHDETLPMADTKLKIEKITTGTGRKLTGQRRYRTCVPKGR